ncbi:MAG TPA: tetratricopeptide repeat protein [Blastocatellia bacterium]|nr:tetratricopeptide repeat protein [Blastocatellia bacterium]
MFFELSINKPAAKAVLALVVSCLCAMLSYAIISNFIVSALTDERANVSRDTLRSAVRYFPNSARLNARLAAASEMADAEAYALQAINLSPHNYTFHILLATIKESNGEAQAAEASLREALRLAPNKTEAHWQLANLLLRTGKLGQAVSEFRVVCAANQKLLPVTLAIVWRASGGKLEAVEAVTASDAKSKLALAGFLLKQSRADDAANVFNQIERKARLALPETSEFINALAGSDRLELARKLWVDLASDDGKERPFIWNGSFESDIVKGFAQFNWTIDRSDYAKIKISAGQAHSGSRALRVDFTGRDTTRLTNEIRQLTVLNSGARYLLECYAKAEKLVTTEGPRIAVTTRAGDLIAVSEPVDLAQTGWQQLAIEFTAPQIPDAFYVTVKRKSKFSYDEPTTGTVWFDDFTLTEVKQSR